MGVTEVPIELIAHLGGLKQMKVKGKINGTVYKSNVMPAGSGRLVLSVSQKMMKAADVGVGDLARFEIEKRD